MEYWAVPGMGYALDTAAFVKAPLIPSFVFQPDSSGWRARSSVQGLARRN